MCFDAESITQVVNTTLMVRSNTTNNKTKMEKRNTDILLISVISSAGSAILAVICTITVLIILKIGFIISSKLNR